MANLLLAAYFCNLELYFSQRLFVTNVLLLRNEAHFTSGLLVANANCVQLCGIQIALSRINPPVMKHFHQK
jgi:hypothetical protein